MARRRAAHEAHQQAIASLGKDLSRRAGSVCELCGGREGLRPVLLAQAEEVEVGSALLACGRCRELVADPAARLPPSDDLRFLEGAAWAEVVPVQVAAVQLLRRLAEHDVPWAVDLLEGLWLPEEVQARLDGPADEDQA